MAYVTLEDLAGGLGQIKTPAQLEAEAASLETSAANLENAARGAPASTSQSLLSQAST